MQQRRQFQRDQRRQLRRLQHHRVARHQRRQSLRRRNRERIIPRRDDSNHAMRLAHQPSTLQLGGQVAVRHRLVAQQTPGVVDQESCRVEHDQNFGGQRLGERLARFARDGIGDFGFLLVQLPLKLRRISMRRRNPSSAHACLRRARPRHGRLHTRSRPHTQIRAERAPSPDSPTRSSASRFWIVSHEKMLLSVLLRVLSEFPRRTRRLKAFAGRRKEPLTAELAKENRRGR